ncbi:MAG: hypothetical protein AB2A00_27135 [Myxococcota bacterium]
MIDEVRLLAVGPYGSGKTTFIAALWNALMDADKSALAVDSVTDSDKSYLAEIRDRWLKFEPVGRTDVDRHEHIELALRTDAGQRLRLSVPDISGERVERHVIDRSWARQFDELVSQCTGLLFFIGPEVKDPHRLDDAQLIAAEVADVAADAASAPSAQSVQAPLPEWTADICATQVMLVELLQLMTERRAGHPLPAVVIISAWDIWRDQTKGPRNWLRQRLPLLSQFLDGNEQLPCDVVGISAQGGDYTSEQQRDHLKKLAPHERPVVDDGQAVSHDITRPIASLIARMARPNAR